MSIRGNRLETALITGASTGIGRALALEFAAHGTSLILVARSASKLQELASEIELRFSVKATPLPWDLSRANSSVQLFRTVAGMGLPVDVLINNAGSMYNGEFVDLPLADQRMTIKLNVEVPTELAYLFLPPMLERGYGRLMNVGSMSGFLPLPRLAVYAASKAYLLQLSEALSEELRGTGVTVTALCPGFTSTRLFSLAPDVDNLPPFPVSKPEDVARDGYRACVHGSPLHVCGVANQVAMQVIQHQPRWFTRAFGGVMARRNRQGGSG